MRRAPAKPVRACTLRKLCPASHVTLEAPRHTSHLTVSHSTLHTALFTPHTSHCTLHIPHFISSELFSPYPSSSLLISSLLICHLSFHESLPTTTTTTTNLHAPCASQARACVLCAKLLQCCCPRTWPARDPRRMQTLSSHFTLHQNWENLLTNHFRSLDAAVPIRFTIFSCKRQ